MGFTKLDEGILQSSIMAADPVTFKVWIALLAACEADGIARVAPTFLAAVCHLPLNAVRSALDELASPDVDSRTPDMDGVRIVRCDGGWRILNYLKYRRLGIREAESAARTERRHVRSVSGHGPDPSASASTSVSVEGVQGEPQIPPADRTERAIKAGTDALRSRLLVIVGEAEAVDPKHRSSLQLMKLFTGYTRPDGTVIGGVANPGGLSYERLEKSLEDAEACLAEWRQKRGA